MKWTWLLLGFLWISLEASLVKGALVHYGRSNEPIAYFRDDEDDDAEEDDDEESDDEQDDGIYPPDFSKLFPNPEGRPVGPEGGAAPQSQQGYPGNHPTEPQHGRPSHGPASMRGPAALRGPAQAQHGQRQGGIGYGQPSRDGPSRRYASRPPPRYRLDLSNDLSEEGVVETAPSYSPYIHGYGQRSFYAPTTYDSLEEPWAPRLGRVYNPWSRSPLRADAYNPQFVFNPTEMRARRRFRYHPSQAVPYQRVPIYSGTWGNPRNSYVHSQTGGHYAAPYWVSRF